MREDEVEALLALDNAGLEVGKTSNLTQQWEAVIRIPKDFHHPHTVNNPLALAFTGYGETRQEAIANVWQKYMHFTSSEIGLQAIADANGQMMFRV